MKKVFMLMMIVIALVGVNAAIVSADAVNPSPTPASNTVFEPLSHGVDH